MSYFTRSLNRGVKINAMQRAILDKICKNDWKTCNPLNCLLVPPGLENVAVAVAPFCVNAKRVLVIASCDRQFEELSDDLMGSRSDINTAILYKINAISEGEQLPCIHRITSSKQCHNRDCYSKDMILASVNKFRYEKLSSDLFDVIIIDGSMNSNKWQSIVDHFNNEAKVIIV